MKRMLYGKLDGKNVVPCDSDEWARNFERDRRVARTDVAEGIHVSTVFLGLNHWWTGSGDFWFESMTFGGPTDQDMDRYPTWDEAEAGHARMVHKAEQAHAKLQHAIESLTTPDPKD